MTTICECGLAKCYHEGDHNIATKPRQSFRLLFSWAGLEIYRRVEDAIPVCTGYKPRKKDWWK